MKELKTTEIQIKNIKDFIKHKHIVKCLFLKGEIKRCIGWEVYRSINDIPFNEHKITDKYVMILDETDDIDYPEDYEKFKRGLEK